MADKKNTSGKLLGIDIGSSSVKLAEVLCEPEGLTVTALGEAPIPEGIIANEDIQDSKTLALIIKKLCKDCGTTCKKAVFSITAPTNTLVRTIEVPKTDNAKQTRLSVKYEVERLFPHSSYDTEFDFVELPNKKSDASNVFVVASYRKLVEDLLKVSKLSGLQLDAIEVADLALGRSLINEIESQSEPICGILEIGASRSTITVYDGVTIKNPGLGISVNGLSFTRTISNTMGTSFIEAEEFKKDYAMLNMDIIKEYYDKKYATDFEFDSSSFDTAFDDPNYNPAYANQQGEENPFDFNSEEENPFESTQEENPFESTEENPFDFNSEEETPSENGEEIPEESNEQSEKNTQENSEDFNLQEENEKLAEEIAAKGGVKFSLEDMEDETDASGKQEVETRKVDPEKSNDICQMLLEQLENLQNEIRSQLDEYYNTTGVNVQKLILVGGSSKIPGMDEFLTEYLGIDVFQGNPRNVIKFRMNNTNMDVLENINTVYPVAIGLAMRDFVE